MKKQFTLLFVLLFVYFLSNGQTQFNGWLASFNTFKLNNKLSLHFDAQLRSNNDLEHVQTLLLRSGLNVHVGKNWILTAGYAYIGGRRSTGTVARLMPEHRIWQQVIFNHKLKNIPITHRFRFEERFISAHRIINDDLERTGFNDRYRFRYFVRGIVPFSSQPTFSKGLFVALQNEVFLNVAKKSAVNGKTFDQNRLYAAIGYRLPGKLDLEAGYMNQYTVGTISFVNSHIAQIAVYKRL